MASTTISGRLFLFANRKLPLHHLLAPRHLCTASSSPSSSSLLSTLSLRQQLQQHDDTHHLHQHHQQPTGNLSELEDVYTSVATRIESETPQNTHVATVALVGAPNAGKSSLSNALIQHRVSAVSRKINTTRGCTTGIYTDNDRQLVMLDTPGLVERAFMDSLGPARRKLSSETWGTAAESDFALFVVDASRGQNYWKYYAQVASQLANMRHTQALKSNNGDAQMLNGMTMERAIIKDEPISNCILILNKSDVTRPKIKLLAAQDYFMNNVENFKDRFHSKIFVTTASAFKQKGITEVRDYLLKGAPRGEFIGTPGVPYFDDDLQVIRQHVWEKLLHRVHKEVPYKCSFENDDFRIASNGDIFVSDIIRAPSNPTCYMIVGKGGDVLRWIKDSAERSASEVLGKRVTLKLTVMPAKARHGHIDSEDGGLY